MKFTLKIELGNAAMQTGREIIEALHQISRSVCLPDDEITEPIQSVSICDENGNTVGAWKVTK